MDFAFKKNSPQHGQFLVECYETEPGIEITDVSSEYFMSTVPGETILHVFASNELAVVLKLRFGSYMRERPTRKSVKFDNIYRKVGEHKNKIRFIDYITYKDKYSSNLWSNENEIKEQLKELSKKVLLDKWPE